MVCPSGFFIWRGRGGSTLQFLYWWRFVLTEHILLVLLQGNKVASLPQQAGACALYRLQSGHLNGAYMLQARSSSCSSSEVLGGTLAAGSDLCWY